MALKYVKKIRKSDDIPIIMLTARGETTDKIVGLEIGADDYLAKPFEPRELVARVKNLIKRNHDPKKQNDNTIQFNVDKQEITIEDKTINLTNKKISLFTLFANNPGKIFSRDDILNELQGIEADFFLAPLTLL